MNKTIKEFVIDRFRGQGETPRSFARNSIYSREAVDQVLMGQLTSPRIRRDIAKYLGYQDWGDLRAHYQWEIDQSVEAHG